MEEVSAVVWSAPLGFAGRAAFEHIHDGAPHCFFVTEGSRLMTEKEKDVVHSGLVVVCSEEGHASPVWFRVLPEHLLAPFVTAPTNSLTSPKMVAPGSSPSSSARFSFSPRADYSPSSTIRNSPAPRSPVRGASESLGSHRELSPSATSSSTHGLFRESWKRISPPFQESALEELVFVPTLPKIMETLSSTVIESAPSMQMKRIAFFPENLIPLAEFVRVRLYRSSSPGPVPEQIFKNLVQLHLEAVIKSYLLELQFIFQSDTGKVVFFANHLKFEVDVQVEEDTFLNHLNKVSQPFRMTPFSQLSVEFVDECEISCPSTFSFLSTGWEEIFQRFIMDCLSPRSACDQASRACIIPHCVGVFEKIRLLSNPFFCQVRVLPVDVLASESDDRFQRFLLDCHRLQALIVFLPRIDLLFPESALRDSSQAWARIRLLVTRMCSSISSRESYTNLICVGSIVSEYPIASDLLQLFPVVIPSAASLKTIDEDFVRSEISRSWKIKDVDWGAWDTYAAFRFLASHFEHYSSVSAIDVHAAIVRGLSSPHSQDKKDGDPNRVAPPVSMEDVYGMENVKRCLLENVTWPVQYASVFRKFGLRPTSGILLEWARGEVSSLACYDSPGSIELHGPPGTGKTLVAKALCRDANLHFIYVPIADILCGEIGASEKKLHSVFEEAKLRAPSVIFFDEIQAIFGSRDVPSAAGSRQLLTQLIHEFDDLNPPKPLSRSSNRRHEYLLEGDEDPIDPVIVLGTTNVLSALDNALLRPGRFEHVLFVGLPDFTSRCSIARARLLSTWKSSCMESSIDSFASCIAEESEGCSGAEIRAISDEVLRSFSSVHEVTDAPFTNLDVIENIVWSARASLGFSELDVQK